MTKDPVVEEVRIRRDTYARQFKYDIEAICRDLQDREEMSGRQYVSFAPKPARPLKTAKHHMD